MPAGWTGYFELTEGSANANLPPPGPAFEGADWSAYSDFSAPPPSCSVCTCGAPSGASCTPPTQLDVGDSTCTGSPTCAAQLSNDWTQTCPAGSSSFLPGGQLTCGPSATQSCSTNTGSPCNVSVSMGPLELTGGACAASAQSPTIVPAAFNTASYASGVTDMSNTLGCTGTDVCLARPDPGYGSTLCIRQLGIQSCPAGPFSNAHIYYSGYTDTRSCSDCGCGVAAGESCTATIQLFSSASSCAGAPIATLSLTESAGDCKALSGNPAVGVRSATVSAPTGGTCAPTGGQPQGSADADPTSAVTYCCQ